VIFVISYHWLQGNIFGCFSNHQNRRNWSFRFFGDFFGIGSHGIFVGEETGGFTLPKSFRAYKISQYNHPYKPTMLGDLFFVGDLVNGSLSYGMKIPMGRQPPFGRICMFGSPFRSHRTVADPSFLSMKF